MATKAAGLVLAAGGIAAANEVIFAPVAGHGKPLQNFNWRVIPATAILALTLGGLEKLSEPLGKGLAALVLLSVLVIPVGNAGTPLENAAAMFGATKK